MYIREDIPSGQLLYKSLYHTENISVEINLKKGDGSKTDLHPTQILDFKPL